MAHLHFLERDLALEQAGLFNLVRAALHADESEADAFRDQLLNPKT